MARPDGVVIASERLFAFAGRDVTPLEGDMPRVPRLARRIPLVRGIARLGMSLSPLLRRGGVAGQLERLVLFAVVLAPIAFVFLPSRAALVAGIAMSVGLVAWLMRGRTLYLHGAEHRRSEERRVGKECRARWSPDHEKKKEKTLVIEIIQERRVQE